MMFTEAPILLQLAVGLVFLVASLAKLRHPIVFVAALGDYTFIPRRLHVPAGVLVIVLESTIAVTHLGGVLLPLVVPIAVATLGLFLFVAAHALVRGVSARCLCFGVNSADVVTSQTIGRLLMLIAAELVVWQSASAGNCAPVCQMPVRDYVHAMLGSGLLIALASWILLAPSLLGLLVRKSGVRRTR